MKIGVQFDEKGEFVGDFLEGMELPEGHTLVRGEIPQGLFRPFWNGSEVVEGMPQEEIDAIRNAPIEPSPLEQLEKDHVDLVFQLLMKGVL